MELRSKGCGKQMGLRQLKVNIISPQIVNDEAAKGKRVGARDVVNKGYMSSR